VATCHGQANIDILPDSGADICAAGPQFVKTLGEYMDNLAESDVAPKAVNGTISYSPWGSSMHFDGRSRDD
jgi:hypothetical protein